MKAGVKRARHSYDSEHHGEEGRGEVVVEYPGELLEEAEARAARVCRWWSTMSPTIKCMPVDALAFTHQSLALFVFIFVHHLTKMPKIVRDR